MSVLILLVFIALSALFAASETAFFTLREGQVRLMVERRERNADIIAMLKEDPQRLLITLLIGNSVMNISIASYATVLAIGYFESFGAGIATGISTVVVLLLGEIFLKTAAYAYRKHFAQWAAYPIYIAYMICFPITSLFVTLEEWMKKRSGTHGQSSVSEEEIRIMVELGLEHGEIEHHERQMIENVFRFDDILVGSIMTKKRQFDALSGDVPVEQIAFYVSQSGFSRFPVYDDKPDNFVGYVHTNDVMRVLNSDRRDEPLENFTSPLTCVGESSNIEEVFRLMTKERSHMYLVHAKAHPEKIVGLVTMEDILEEIMGEIEDEGDKRDAQKMTRPTFAGKGRELI